MGRKGRRERKERRGRRERIRKGRRKARKARERVKRYVNSCHHSSILIINVPAIYSCHFLTLKLFEPGPIFQ